MALRSHQHLLGERLLEMLAELYRGMLLKLMELRYGSASTSSPTPSWAASCATRRGSAWAKRACVRGLPRGDEATQPAPRSRYHRLCPEIISDSEAGKYSVSSDLSKKVLECGLFQAELTNSPRAAPVNYKNSQVRSSVVK